MLEPRLDPDEIDYLKDFVFERKGPDTKMVEWGSGGSTLMFLPYFEEGSFVSIEHNEAWFDKVTGALGESGIPQEALRNFTYCHAPPTWMGRRVDLSFHGYGVPMEENPCFVSRYINPETEHFEVFDADIYFVDGIARGPILATIKQKARRPNATVFIHDYYGRENRIEWYNWASGLYSRVEQVGSTLARLYL